jgi:hypothetical protein
MDASRVWCLEKVDRNYPTTEIEVDPDAKIGHVAGETMSK